jgi:hypothetical protein
MTITFYKERTMSTRVRNSAEYREVYRVPAKGQIRCGEYSLHLWRIFSSKGKEVKPLPTGTESQTNDFGRLLLLASKMLSGRKLSSVPDQEL